MKGFATAKLSMAAAVLVWATPAFADLAVDQYFGTWYDRVGVAQASQPHWMTPLMTVTPRLEQEFRYDQYWEHTGTGADIAIRLR